MSQPDKPVDPTTLRRQLPRSWPGLAIIALAGGLVAVGCSTPPAPISSTSASPASGTAAVPRTSGEPTPDPPRTAEPSHAPPVTTSGDASRWRCESQADCVQTCALGAVSRTWLAAHPSADSCDDGCYWSGGPLACRDHRCATLTADGRVNESCTEVPDRR